MSEAPRPAPTLGELASCFLQIALSSFGGGLSAWTRRLVVEQRQWLNDEQFLSALTIARLFPGPNQVNMAIWMPLQNAYAGPDTLRPRSSRRNTSYIRHRRKTCWRCTPNTN